MPIDLNDLRDYRGGNAEKVRETLRRRFKSPDLVDEIIALDEQWRQCIPSPAFLLLYFGFSE